MNAPAPVKEKEGSSDGVLSKVDKENVPASVDPVVPDVNLVEVPLNTSEDAVMAFLRDQIDEKVLRSVIGKYGRISYNFLTKEQIMGFGKQIPEDLVFDQPIKLSSHQDQLDAIKRKEDERKEAMEQALKDTDDPAEKRALEADLERFYPSDKKK